MGRVINTNTPGKRRNYHMRTIAEILRHLSQHSGEVDDEVRDMVAMIVYALRDIDASVLESISAWEKRGYWKKADKFQRQWMWAGNMANTIEAMALDETWNALPDVMMKLFPHFSDIQVNKLMRKPSEWRGAYDELVAEAEDADDA
jgi:hypothetical protein